MPLTLKRNDTADTTEEAVLALVKRRYDAAEAAGQPQPYLDALGELAEALGAGEHWNVEVPTSFGTTQQSHAGL